MIADESRQAARSLLRKAAEELDPTAALAAMRSLAVADAKPHDIAFCAGFLPRLSPALAARSGAQTLRIFLVRSVTVEPFVPYLKVEAALAGFLLEIKIGGFGSYADDLLNPASELLAWAPDVVLVLLDLEDIAGALPDLCASGTGAGVAEEVDAAAQRFGQLLSPLRQRSSARVIVQGLVAPDTGSLGDVAEANLPHSLRHAVATLNLRIAEFCRQQTDFLFFDADHLAARHGRARWRDDRLFLSSRLPIAASAFGPYTRGLVRFLSALYRPSRKVLCTDLDNTLWGGILGEDGVDGIVTGSTFPGTSYLLYQRFLKQLSSRGILLAIVSKNNEADVREAFERRAADLAVTLDDFVAHKVNWNDKAQSIRELAETLSLGLDSFVFVDDNPVECEAIRQHLPSVAVLAVPIEEPWTLPCLLARQPFFDTLAVTRDDTHRLHEYKAQAQREELATSSGSRDEFLASLDIVCTFSSALDAPLARAVQLLAKTNQFNLTTRRHSAADIQHFASTPGGQALVVRVRDRFGDAGVVGLALATTSSGRCLIDSFLLSCRVIGRGIETALLARIAQNAAASGATTLAGEFLPSKKNALCAGFYPQHGFEPASPNNAAGADQPVLYELNLASAMPQTPHWIRIEEIPPHEPRTDTHIAS